MDIREMDLPEVMYKALTDNWYYALVLKGGLIVSFSEIKRFYNVNGEFWITVECSDFIPDDLINKKLIHLKPNTSRMNMDIKVNNILSVFETADT